MIFQVNRLLRTLQLSRHHSCDGRKSGSYKAGLSGPKDKASLVHSATEVISSTKEKIFL